jgi:hypothetical protein
MRLAAPLPPIKDHIAALDKQIGTFDKLAASAGKVMKSTDPVVRSIAESSSQPAEGSGSKSWPVAWRHGRWRG